MFFPIISYFCFTFYYTKLSSNVKSNRLDVMFKDLLGGSKDKIPYLEKSGIYRIECSNCDKC